MQEKSLQICSLKHSFQLDNFSFENKMLRGLALQTKEKSWMTMLKNCVRCSENFRMGIKCQNLSDPRKKFKKLFFFNLKYLGYKKRLAYEEYYVKLI